MRTFANPQSKEFIKAVKDALKINQLKKTAIPFEGEELKKYKLKYNGRYHSQCRIHFNGISGTFLLDKDGKYRKKQSVIHESLKTIFEHAEKINNKGILIKIRFLLLYPYTHYAGPIVQAEMTKNRSTIKDPNFPPDFLNIEGFEEFYEDSYMFKSQKECLGTLQDFLDTPGWNTHDSPNSLRLRFSVLSPTICSLVVNDTAFYDAYHLAKRDTKCNEFARDLPVVEVRRNRSNQANTPELEAEARSFCCVTDHFRYLWRHNTTLFSEDATKHVYGKPLTLKKIKKPDVITLDYKSKWLAKQNEITSSDERIIEWKRNSKIQLEQITTIPRDASNRKENLFISCSWNGDEPNLNAKKIEEWIGSDFGKYLGFKVNIVKADLTQELEKEIYEKLETATSAIVFLTKDIKAEDGKWYTRPNIYHELGYCMHKYLLKSQYSEDVVKAYRLAILLEDGAEKPSNIINKTTASFGSEKIALIYVKLLKWLIKFEDSLFDHYLCTATDSHSSRLNIYNNEKLITPDEYEKAIERLNILKKQCKCEMCNNKNRNL